MDTSRFTGGWIAAVLISIAFQAQADLLVYSDTNTLPVLSEPPDPVVFKIPRFDPQLGTLHRAHAEISATAAGSLNFTNLSADAGWFISKTRHYVHLYCDGGDSPFWAEFLEMYVPAGDYGNYPIDGNAEYTQSWNSDFPQGQFNLNLGWVTGTGYPISGGIVPLPTLYSGFSSYGFSFEVTASAALTVTYDFTPRPALSLKLTGDGSVIVSWPTNAAGYELERKTNSLAAAFGAVTNAPVVDGTNWMVTFPVARPAEFFRLHRQP